MYLGNRCLQGTRPPSEVLVSKKEDDQVKSWESSVRRKLKGLVR